MAKARWWVCDGCHSLNDLPADKCYKCRVAKPDNPRQMDDQYAEVSSGPRVGITVDLSQVGDLTRPDPVETQEGGGFIDAFDPQGNPEPQAQQPVVQQQQPPQQPYDPYAAPPTAPSAPSGATQQPQSDAPPPPKPLRDPTRRGIDQLGGVRQWADGVEVMPPMPAAPSPESNVASAPAPAAPPPQQPATGQVAPPTGQAPPPQAPPPPPQAQTQAPPPPPPQAPDPPPAGAMPPPDPNVPPPPPAPTPEKPDG